jgi:hypothetical protein
MADNTEQQGILTFPSTMSAMTWVDESPLTIFVNTIGEASFATLPKKILGR